MTETNPPRRVWRSVLAVVAGLVTVVALDTGSDAVMHATHVFAPFQPMADNLYLLALAYRAVDGVIGGYVAARLAPDRPVRHAVILGCIGVAASIAGAAAFWNKGPEYGPKWYPLTLVVIALPCAWLGGKLRALQMSSR